MQGLQSKVCLCQVAEAFLPKQSRGGQDLKTPRLRTDPMQQAGDRELLLRWVQRAAGEVGAAIPMGDPEKWSWECSGDVAQVCTACAHSQSQVHVRSLQHSSDFELLDIVGALKSESL